MMIYLDIQPPAPSGHKGTSPVDVVWMSLMIETNKCIRKGQLSKRWRNWAQMLKHLNPKMNAFYEAALNNSRDPQTARDEVLFHCPDHLRSLLLSCNCAESGRNARFVLSSSDESEDEAPPRSSLIKTPKRGRGLETQHVMSAEPKRARVEMSLGSRLSGMISPGDRIIKSQK